MNILEEARTLLSSAAYSVSRPSPDKSILYFEDDRSIGILWEASTIQDLLENWWHYQDAFLGENAKSLRTSGEKTWNLYYVVLTSEQPSEASRMSMVEIEEDFGATRKIAGSGILTVQDLQDALLPLLPIQKLGTSTSTHDTRNLIRRRLQAMPEGALNALISPGAVDDRITNFIKAYATKKSGT